MADIFNKNENPLTAAKIKQYYPYFVNFAKARLKEKSYLKIHYKELVNQTILNVLSSKDELDGIEHFKTYFIRTMINACNDFERDRYINIDTDQLTHLSSIFFNFNCNFFRIFSFCVLYHLYKKIFFFK